MRNGAGKTTTVRILGTLISPTVGSVVVAGIPVGPGGAAEIRRRVTEALAAVGLADRARHLAGRLSKGLRQRAALARSLLNEPAVMFLDERASIIRCSSRSWFRCSCPRS